jgi:predicted metal-dependent phosphoesterase TrpH
MTKLTADLHIHTIYSDGELTPEEAVRTAKKIGLAAISITDHDSTDGVLPALKEGQVQGVEVIPGVELSTELKSTGESEMHILGYFINFENGQFQESLQLFRKTRQTRARKILDLLLKEGVKLDEEKLFSSASKGTIGRLHFAKALVKQGFVKDIGSAFDKYLGFGKPAYVAKWQLKPEEAINMILKIGGIPVLAHPHYGNYANRDVLKGLMSSGLQGIEVFHSNHPKWAIEKYRDIALEMGLLETGGSDCHGAFGSLTSPMGRIKVPYELVEKMKKRKQEITA